MFKRCWKHRGSVTIFLAAIMLFMFIFSFSVFDIGRIYLAQNTLESATDLALNAGLTTYDKTLKDMYGLLATSADEKELSEKLSKYFVATLESNGIQSADEGKIQEYLNAIFDNQTPDLESDSFLKLTAQTFGDNTVQATKVSASAISNPNVMHRQIVEYMKYRGPISMASGILEKFGMFKDLSNQAKATNAKLEFEDSMSDLATTAGKIYAQIMLYQRNNAQLAGNPYSVNLTQNVRQVLNEYDFASYEITGFTLPVNQIQTRVREIYRDLYFAALSGIYFYPYTNLWSGDPLLFSYNDPAIQLVCTTKGFTGSEGMFSLYDEIMANETYQYLKNRSLLRTNFHGKDSLSPDSYSVEDDKDYYKALLNCQELFNNTRYFDPGTYSTDFSHLVLKAYARRARLDILLLTAGEEEAKTLQAEIILFDDLSLESHLGKVREAVIALKNEGNRRYNNAIERLEGFYCAVQNQKTLLDSILQPNGGLDTLLSEIADAKAKSDNWREANKGVQMDSVRGGLEDQWASEAETIDSVTYTEIEKIKKLLENQRALFSDLKSSLRKFTVYYCQLCSDNDYVYNIGKTTLRDCMDESFNGNYHSNFEMIPLAYYPSDPYEFSYLNYYSGLWECLNTEIQDTAVFDYLKKMCVTTVTVSDEQRSNGENVKNQVDGRTELNDDGIPSDKPTGGSESAKNLNKDIQKFSDFYADAAKSSDKSVGSVKMSKGSDDDTNKATKNMATNALSSASGLFTDLGTILEKERDKLYITEYLNNMFSCHTTNVSPDSDNPRSPETNLAGYSYTDENQKGWTDWYQSELEYIIYGQDTPAANVALAGASIFGIRFALNLIYSFTDAEIRAFTLSVATSIGAIIPFSIPLIQTVLHIGLSLAESAIDLSDLLDGKSVPIFKTSGTWVCKGTGLVKKVAADVAKKAADAAIDTAADWAVDLIQKAEGKSIEWTGEAAEKLNEQVKLRKKEIEDTIKSEFLTPIQNGIQEVITNGIEGTEKIKQAISDKVDQAFSTLDAGSADDNLLGKARKAAVSALRSKKDSIVKTLTDHMNDYINQAIQVTENTTNGLIEKLKGDLKDALDSIEEKVTALTGEIESGIKSAISEAADSLSKGVVSTKDKLKSTVSQQLDGLISGGSDTKIISGGKKVSAANMLSMTYKDYLYLFSLIGTHAGEDAMLERAAKLMQINITAVQKGKAYNINAACTVLCAETGASVNTVFLGTLIQDGQVVRDKKIGEFSLRYKTYAGY